MDKIKSVNRVFLATILISIAGAYVNEWISGYTDNDIVRLLFSQIILVIPTIVYMIINKINPLTAIRFHKVKGSNIVLIILFAYLIMPFMSFINSISMLFVHNDIQDVMSNIVENNNLFLSVFMVAFVPCILEESVYRGIFYNEYRKVKPLLGIVLSAFLFGIMHGNINQFSYAFAMGIIFALLIEATDSILSTMIVHFVINGTSVLLMVLYQKLLAVYEIMYESDANDMLNSLQSDAINNIDITFVLQYGLIAITPTILAFLVYRAIARNTGRWDNVKNLFRKITPNNADTMQLTEYSGENYPLEKTNKEKKSIFTFSLILGICICIFLMIANEIYSQTPEQPLEEIVSTMIHFLFS